MTAREGKKFQILGHTTTVNCLQANKGHVPLKFLCLP